MSDYANVNYARLTHQDRNPLKRRLQHKRLEHGLAALKSLPANFSGRVLDFGAGDGELSRRIAERFLGAEVVCYEPSEKLRRQAERNLSQQENVKLVGTLDAYPEAYFDYVFCLEVFEHLPDEQIHQALRQIYRLVNPAGLAIVGVPNEIFLAALFKGVLRLKRRYGETDARFFNILRAFAGLPPRERPVVEFDNLPYIIRHMGFNHRRFKKQLEKYFSVGKTYGSPNIYLPIFLNLEVYFVCKPTY